MSKAYTYPLINDFIDLNNKANEFSVSANWIVAIVRQGTPLSFSRVTMSSITNALAHVGDLRAQKPLIITGDCTSLQLNRSKRSHIKQLSATLQDTTVNYLVEVLPGDWVFAWLFTNEADYNSVLGRLSKLEENVNNFNDGLKFVGRVASLRKKVNVNKATGKKVSSYSLTAAAFTELESSLFYDHSLATKSDLIQDIGTWLARIGINIEEIFGSVADRGTVEGNVNLIIPRLIDLIVGKGVSKDVNITNDQEFGPKDIPPVAAGAGAEKNAPFAYVIPDIIGNFLAVPSPSSSAGIMAYADILYLLSGVQEYNNPDLQDHSKGQGFIPVLQNNSVYNRLFTNKKMLGTFLPFMPQFVNKPLWQILQQYLNPAINELFTCMRVNDRGRIVPTVVMRQIPFTTEVFDPNNIVSTDPRPAKGNYALTRFLSVPRWQMHPNMIDDVDIGRADGSRVNFIHVYGQALYAQNNVPVTTQITNNPPIRDDFDIQRSGLRAMMSTVECAVSDEVEDNPGRWMALIADWMMGSQYTLNGTIGSTGIQAPICEGDNLEFDGVVYHIESITDICQMSGENGFKTFNTYLSLSNGMRAEIVNSDLSTKFPIYPGFDKLDNTQYDPGISIEGPPTLGGDSESVRLADNLADAGNDGVLSINDSGDDIS